MSWDHVTPERVIATSMSPKSAQTQHEKIVCSVETMNVLVHSFVEQTTVDRVGQTHPKTNTTAALVNVPLAAVAYVYNSHVWRKLFLLSFPWPFNLRASMTEFIPVAVSVVFRCENLYGASYF